MNQEPQNADLQFADSAAALAAEMFLHTVARSQIIDDAALRQTLRDAPPAIRGNAEALADFFVRTGKLTRYQARKCLRGVTRGLILGKYQILAPVGKGGMGTVFLARDGRNGPLVALKVLPPAKAKRKRRSLVRFLREMALSKHVRHPNLAWTYEAGRIGDIYYIALEYIPGKNLSKLVSEDGPLTVSRAARLIAEAAEGLHHAHEQGVIHRDLKPSNIMVTPHEHAKVLDLGLALVEGEAITDHRVVGGQGVIVGTMDYIAPEQTRNAAGVDRRADVYSLGCTLYFALTGRPPFPGGDSKDKIRRQRTEEPQSLLELRPDLPLDFAALVQRMMSKEPSQRLPTAQAAADALKKWIGQERVLPLDKPEDADYQAAVSAAEATEMLPSGSTTDLPVVEAPPELWSDLTSSPVRVLWVALGLVIGALALSGGLLTLAYRLGWLR